MGVTMKSAMRREPVDSSTLASVGYDETQFLLELEFRSGELYQYFGPPHNIHRDLMTADSKGRFFNQHIRHRFPFIRLQA
jgi:KTSC domain